MTWLNRVPFLTTLTLLLLCVAGLLLRLLPGSVPVVFSVKLGSESGGPAMFSLSVVREPAGRLTNAWLEFPYDFKPISWGSFKAARAKGKRSPS